MLDDPAAARHASGLVLRGGRLPDRLPWRSAVLVILVCAVVSWAWMASLLLRFLT